MKDNNYNLVILHHEGIFDSRESAINYLNDFYKPNSLEGEIAMVKYGEERNPKAILALGTSNAAPGSFYAIDIAKVEEGLNEISEAIEGDKEEIDYASELIQGIIDSSGLTLDENKIENKISYEPDYRDEIIGDAKTIAEAIDLLSKYTQQGLSDKELSVEDTESIALIYSVNSEGGMTLKAKVNISKNGDSDELNFNNNIIGVKNDGIYAAANLSYDEVRHRLTFTTSGYKNGRYQDDAIVKNIELGEHTKIVADNDGKTVKLTVSENNDTATLSADLQIAERENNILKASDGKVYVEGLSRNIKHGDTTVADELTTHKNNIADLQTGLENAAKSAHVEGGQTDTFETVVSELSDGGAKVMGNVRLGSSNSIVVRNGGLEANITIDVDAATNKLIVTIGNQTITKTLPGVELFESAEYNDENEELIITFRTGNTLVIPIHGIIHTWDVENFENSPISLSKTVVTGGVDKLSGNIKLRSTDNLIGIENGKLYVSGLNIDNKISVETNRATTAENALQRNIENAITNMESRFDSLSDSISDTNAAIAEEKTRAIGAENQINSVASHADEIAQEAKDNVTSLSSTVGELSTSLTSLETNVEGIQESVSEIATIRTNLTNEINRSTTKDTQLEGLIASTNESVTTEKNRALAAESVIQTNLTTLEQNLVSRITHDISDVNTSIQNEITRATAAENANATRISELEEAVGEGSAQALADAMQYTDNKIASEKTAREAKDTELNTKIETLETNVSNQIATAVRDASDDATSKANNAKSEANAYADEKVLAEKTAREAKETEIETAIANEAARATAAEENLATEIGNKIESVEIVKNTQSDLQYVLKVDGVDAGEINIPKDQFLKSVTYDAGNKALIFVFETTEGTVTTNVNVNDLVDTYTAGNGLSLNGNQFSVKLNEESEGYLTVTNEGIKLFGIDEKFNSAKSEANAYADEKVLAEKTAREAKETEIETAIANEVTRATAAETANTNAITLLNGNEATEGSVKNAIKVSKDYTDAKVAEKANIEDVYTKSEIDNRGFLTSQDISNLATTDSVNEVSSLAHTNETSINELTTTVEDMKFVTSETNTVRMNIVKETGAESRVLSSDVKLKTISGTDAANIIKSDANGLYATVTFNYDKAANKIVFNDGNGDKEFELNNFGILQDAIYDAQDKSIVLIVKKDDETTERITIPVGDLVNTWTVENAEGSPVILSKTQGEDGDVLSANLSILNNGHNLLVNENGSLFVDSDSNTHIALWGGEVITVQNAINLLKERTDDIEQIKEDIDELQEDNENIKISIASYQTDLENQKERITTNENNISELTDDLHELETNVAVLSEKVNGFEARITEASEKATEALNAVSELSDKLGNLDPSKGSVSDRLERIEEILRQLIDFGEYDIEI